MTYTQTFPIQFDPAAEPEAIVTGPQVRFTVLTSRLLRIEYSPTDTFEDRPSQAFWYRRQPPPEFEVEANDPQISINTDHLQLQYLISETGFSPKTLKIRLKQNNHVWQYGAENTLNLRGTTRTLDNVDGKITLQEGLISRSGWAVYDDSNRLVLMTMVGSRIGMRRWVTRTFIFLDLGRIITAAWVNSAGSRAPHHCSRVGRWATGGAGIGHIPRLNCWG